MTRRKSFDLIFSFTIAVVCVVAFPITAQVANNNVNSRTELIPDQDWLHSTTANSSVEWKCVNKALTKKCLVYHNDQWFHFTPTTSGKFFLKISAQQCRDSQGVQVVIIEGNPCEVSTYRILQCIPKIHQDDLFIELDSLKANTLYLVNIDGFLGDFCAFDIQLSRKPKGLPESKRSFDTLRLVASTNREIISLKWHASHTLVEELEHFEIFIQKASERKSEFIGKVRIKSNALGKHDEDYTYVDTLKGEGEFLYKIIGVGKEAESRILLDQINVVFKNEKIPPRMFMASAPISFAYAGRLEIFILNLKDREILNYWVHEYRNPENLSIDLTKFIQAGIYQFQVKLRHNKTKEVKELYFQQVDGGDIVVIEKPKN